MSLIDDVKEISELVDKSKQLELYSKILDLKGSVSDLTEENRNLKEENNNLKRLLETKEQMIFKEPVYFIEGDEVPYCPKCWEVDKVAVHLVVRKDSPQGYCDCRQCKSWYQLYETPHRTPNPPSPVRNRFSRR